MGVLATALGLAALQVAAPTAPAPAPETVRIDVVAVDAGGRPVETLGAGDFELRDDGIVQALGEVRFVGADRSAGAPAGVFGVYLDEYRVSAANTDRVRAVLGQWIDRDLGEHDRAVIMRPLDSLLTIRLTDDREALRRTIDAFEGRRGDYEPRNAFERSYMAIEAGRAESQRAQTTWSALNALVLHLAAQGPGRKTILLVSEWADRPVRPRGLETLPTSTSVVRAANRSNVSVYVLDPSEAPENGTEADEGPDLRQGLADDTGGAVLPLTGDGGGALGPLVRDATAYYLLTYHPTVPSDGRFHAVGVTVKRPGVRVRARAGYHAPSPADRLGASPPPKPDPLPREVRRTSRLIRPWFGISRGTEGRMRVTFVWEPAPAARTAPAASRVALTALAADGTTVFEGAVLPTGPVASSHEGAPPRAVFEVPPGRVRLRMSIESAASERIDSDVRDILVRDLPGGVALGTPEVLRARTALEVRALEADADAAPVASREFSRAERLIVRVPVYGSGDTAPVVSATLLNRGGQVMRDLRVVSVPGGDGRHQIELALASLAPGEYAIAIAAAEASNRIRETIRFRVTS
jgi:VWFA-related protein